MFEVEVKEGRLNGEPAKVITLTPEEAEALHGKIVRVRLSDFSASFINESEVKPEMAGTEKIIHISRMWMQYTVTCPTLDYPHLKAFEEIQANTGGLRFSAGGYGWSWRGTTLWEGSHTNLSLTAELAKRLAGSWLVWNGQRGYVFWQEPPNPSKEVTVYQITTETRDLIKDESNYVNPHPPVRLRK